MFSTARHASAASISVSRRLTSVRPLLASLSSLLATTSTPTDSGTASLRRPTPQQLQFPSSHTGLALESRRNLASSPHFITKRKPRVVILGTGWGGHTLAKRLDKQKFDVRIVSPANHFLFTPLLPSTAVGTLEFRAIQEPVRTIDGLGEYYQAKARGLDTDRKVVLCEDLFKKHKFEVKYDYLMVAAGNKTHTFDIPGVEKHEGEAVLFLKHLYHARLIRNRILECFERASNKTITAEERSRLLSFVAVGGGATSCEFTTELYDFIHDDVAKWYPDLKKDISLTLLEAGDGLLGQFDRSLADYYLKGLRKRGVDVRLNRPVTGISVKHFPPTPGDTGSDAEDGRAYTIANFADGSELPFGMMVWNAGLAPVNFVKDSGLPIAKGRIAVDDYLRVPDQKGRVFAFGDCCIVGGMEGRKGLPPTASIAEQQAYYLSDVFNEHYYKFDPCHPKNDDKTLPLPGPVVPALLPYGGFPFEQINGYLTQPSPMFRYMNRGAMASMGRGGGVSDLTKSDLPLPKVAVSGLGAFLTWRSVYLTKQLSYTNMILIPMYWFKQMVFGRDISRF